MNTQRTEGEQLFERYLASRDIKFQFEQVHEGKAKRPDYTIEWGGKTHVLDVKDFAVPQLIGGGGGGAFDPYDAIRDKIDEGRAKFKEFKDLCCGLVLHNLGNPFVDLQTADIMQGAMYGNAGFTIPFDPEAGAFSSDRIQPAFLTGGKMVRPRTSEAQNTTLSAMITLTKINPHFNLVVDMMRENPNCDFDECVQELKQEIENFDEQREVPRVIVWHNVVARIPFPIDLFKGPFDMHVTLVPVEVGVVKREILFRGELLPDSVKV